MLKKIFIISLILLLVLSSCGYEAKKEDISKNDNAYFQETYNLDFSNQDISFVILNYDEFNNLIKTEKNSIVVATREDCEYCHTIMPKYISVMEDLDLPKIYFVDTKSLTEDEKSDLRDKHEINVVPTTIINFADSSKEIIYGDTDEDHLRTLFSKIKDGS